jgi:Ca2+:H+ antiporter
VKALAALFLAGPAAVLAAASPNGGPWALVLAATALALASRILGDAVDDVSVHLGPRAGGLVSATLGGFTAFALALFAVRAGMPDLAKAIIVGSIVSSLLLVLGLSLFLGGLRNDTQYFDRSAAGVSGTMMVLAVIALSLPALYGRLVSVRNTGPVETLSEAVATVMIAVYALSLYYSLVWNVDEQAIAGIHREHARRTGRRSVALLLGSIAAVTVLSRVVVGCAADAISRGQWGPLFVGVVALPLVGGVAQHLGAVESAWRNRIDVTMNVTIGSVLQVILFVTPLLVFASVLWHRPMDLIVSGIELAALAAAVLVADLIALDGESQWLEGILLLAVYVLLALAFYWWPSAAAASSPGLLLP